MVERVSYKHQVGGSIPPSRKLEMKSFITFLILIGFFIFPFYAFAAGLPFGTPRVITIFPCLNGKMITVQPPIPSSVPPGPYLVPPGANRKMYFIYPPVPAMKMLGQWVPGGVCNIPGPWGVIPLPTIGTIVDYGSALGF